MQRRWLFMVVVVAWSTGLTLTALATQTLAQAEKKPLPPQDAKKAPIDAGEMKLVKFSTVDHVDLKGKYYGTGKAGSPCVLLLHALGDSSNNKEWTNLAKKLNAKGYAVFMFDFRGHGDSTTVQQGVPANTQKKLAAVPGFWDQATNQQKVKGYAVNKRPSEIRFEQFAADYWPVLCNDIAAAKTFLHKETDCNPYNMVLIGADDGATLGALWLSSEFHRFRFNPPMAGFPKGSLDVQNPEGLATAATVWLSIKNQLGTSKSVLNVSKMLERPAKLYKVPTLFIYGEGDAKGGDLAKAYEKALAFKDKKAAAPKALKIEGAEKLAGRKLLLDSLGTSEQILKFLDGAVVAKAAPKDRNPMDDYYWQWQDASGVNRQVKAKSAGNDLVDFAGYSTFLK